MQVYAELKPLIPKPLAVQPTALALLAVGSATNALTPAASASDSLSARPRKRSHNRLSSLWYSDLLIFCTLSLCGR